MAGLDWMPSPDPSIPNPSMSPFSDFPKLTIPHHWNSPGICSGNLCLAHLDANTAASHLRQQFWSTKGKEQDPCATQLTLQRALNCNKLCGQMQQKLRFALEVQPMRSPGCHIVTHCPEMDLIPSLNLMSDLIKASHADIWFSSCSMTVHKCVG